MLNKMFDNWRWQLSNRIDNTITPYYYEQVVLNSKEVSKTVIPSKDELVASDDESDDPLHEDKFSPLPGLIHKYPDRALFLTTNFCSTYCRYCTRSRIFRRNNPIPKYQPIFDYINNNRNIKDVILSGGDPLTMSTDKLKYLIENIKYADIIRIGTKVPAVLPQRVTDNLLELLYKYRHRLYMSLHFIHPAELTAEAINACNNLADTGVPLGSQTVLLKDVNNNTETLKSLFTGLLKIRVKPYYLYQCDSVVGTNHFRTTIDEGKNIIDDLRNSVSGYAIPKYVVDTPERKQVICG